MLLVRREWEREGAWREGTDSGHMDDLPLPIGTNPVECLASRAFRLHQYLLLLQDCFLLLGHCLLVLM